MDTLKVLVVSPIGTEFKSDDISFIKIKGSRGDVGILPNHANYVTSLGTGQMLIRDINKVEKSYFVDGGFLEVTNNEVIVVAQDVYESSQQDIIIQKRKEAIEKATREKLKEEKDILGTKKKIQDSLRR